MSELYGTSPEAETLMAMDRGDLVPKDNAPGDTSDGSHTFDDLYAHRRALTAALLTILHIDMRCNVWRSTEHHPDDTPIYEGYFIVGADFPTQGTVTYHYEMKYWNDFREVPYRTHAPQWDGAGPEMSINRLLRFARGED